MISGIMLGATLSGRLAGRRSASRTVAIGYGFMSAGIAFNVLSVAFAPPAVVWHVLPIFVFCIGTSVVMPSVTLILLDLFPATRGLAASLQGFIHFALSAVNAGFIVPVLSHSLWTFASGMAAFSAASLACWLVYQRRIQRRPTS
jgi:DHA1 family bicyclomycin/chloramphenicol resistance-like MFS transporter